MIKPTEFDDISKIVGKTIESVHITHKRISTTSHHRGGAEGSSHDDKEVKLVFSDNTAFTYRG